VLQRGVDGAVKAELILRDAAPATVMLGPCRLLVTTVGAETEITPGTTRANAIALRPFSGSSLIRV